MSVSVSAVYVSVFILGRSSAKTKKAVDSKTACLSVSEGHSSSSS